MLRSLTRLGVAASQRHVLLVDGMLALVLLAATTSAGHSWTVPSRHEFDLPGIVLSAAVMLPLAFRRRYPLVAFATIAIVERPRTTAYAAVLFAALRFAGGLVPPGSPVLACCSRRCWPPAWPGRSARASGVCRCATGGWPS